MKIEKSVKYGTLIRRYKRFLADIRLESGELITAHCPNSGSMKGCAEPGWKVLVSDSQNPKRKLLYTWEMVHNGTCWIGINTMVPNMLAFEAVSNNQIPELTGYSTIKKEQKYSHNSRIDLLLEKEDCNCYVEVKNVTLVEDNFYLFPDAVTERGLKHLNDLYAMKKKGNRAVMLYIIQRNDGEVFKPCYAIDPEYSKKLKQVHKKGVEILPYVADVIPSEIKISHKVDFSF